MPEELLNCMGPTCRSLMPASPTPEPRLHELKGGLEIEAADPGTMLRAIIPLLGRSPRLPDKSQVFTIKRWHTSNALPVMRLAGEL
jgi:hypothetical protein